MGVNKPFSFLDDLKRGGTDVFKEELSRKIVKAPPELLAKLTPIQREIITKILRSK
jgi:hypothetical protein